MENKETVKLTIAEAIAINNVMSEAKFGDNSIDTISSLLEFKFELSKMDKNKEDYIKSVVEEFKTDEFKLLSEKEDKSEEEKDRLKTITDELNNSINSVINKYVNRDIQISVSKIDKNEFYTFCKTNNFTMAMIEFLYKKLVK